jgi:hypothetical protein
MGIKMVIGGIEPQLCVLFAAWITRFEANKGAQVEFQL